MIRLLRLLLPLAVAFNFTSSLAGATPPETGGPVRLTPAAGGNAGRAMEPGSERSSAPAARPGPPDGDAYVPGEFERYVQRLAGAAPQIRRLGSALVIGESDASASEVGPAVPADYVVSVGDEVLLTIWGSVDADLRLVVDRSGNIAIPRVGTVRLAGISNADLATVIERRVGQVFRNFQLSVSLGQLRGVRVFVTGFAVRPGTYVVSSQSSVVGTLMRAGGPSSSGSFRRIELRRGAQAVASFDLYDLIIKGDRSADRLVQAGDVIHVAPVGTQVAVIGSVNNPAVLELRPGETVSDALAMVGGFNAVAERQRVLYEALNQRTALRIAPLELPRDGARTLQDGDVLRALSAVDTALPSQTQNRRVVVEGEVAHPGVYVLPQGSTMPEAIRAAGGLTPNAYVYATEFTRGSVRASQRENYERALRDLETEFARSTSSQRVTTAEEAAGAAGRSTANERLLRRLRSLEPSGRVVLQLPRDSTQVPDLLLEDGDRILVPPRPNTVGVFGSVFNAGNYLHVSGKTLGDYLRLAGGSTKGADDSSIFVIRANGTVASARQERGFWSSGSDKLAIEVAEPGDTLFVPEEMDKTTFIQSAKDWAQILSQFGLGLAAIKVLGN